jgi:hypothetical protein
MAVYNTLHVFGYGECQAIGNDYNYKAETSGLPAAQPVVDDVYSKKPQGSDASSDYHAINIFNGMFADYQPKTGSSFRVPFEELDATLCETLVDEIIAAQPVA